MPSIVITPPVDYPITLAGARDFLQVGDDTSEDHMINFFLASATAYCESFMQMALMPRTVVESFATWPTDGYFIRWNPLISIAHIKYYDVDDVLQTIDPADYKHYTSEHVACISLRPSYTFPEVYDRPDAIQITYTAGHDPVGTIPVMIYHALCLELRHGFDFRTNEKIDTYSFRVASERLMADHIIYTYRR